MSLPRTPSQTVGPFFGSALGWPLGPRLVPEGTPGEIHVVGRLLDGDGAPVADGLIETWQAGPDGRYADGFGRSATDKDGRWEIWTLKPGASRAPDGTTHAPHIAISVFARGLLRRLVTRMYFPDEAAANAADPVLGAVTDAAARSTLIAARAQDRVQDRVDDRVDDREGDNGCGYTFDIRLQRQGETVFFDV